uniref:G-protein coupled receptors family 1 profile domain-containing protein n=1 Tax=candidate division CPR3 bacterium TaxID=2268181 RepID=A0A7V3JA16_UNCC3
MSYGIYFVFLPFVLIGSIIAYLITYNEYMRHYQTKKEPRKIALEAAVFAFVLFNIISIFIIFFIIFVLTKLY